MAGEEINSWIASSLAIGVVLENHGVILEDACWLQLINDVQHKPGRTRCHDERC